MFVSCRLHDFFCTRCKKNLKNILEKTLYQARMTWQFEGFQAAIHAIEYIGKIDFACDV